MSVSLSVKGYSDSTNKEFVRHYNVVKVCVENEIDFPEETKSFFKGKLNGSNIEDVTPNYAVGFLQNGMEVEIPMTRDNYGQEITIQVAEIPKECVKIIFTLS